MKWNILIASLVLGMGLCSQSFGFELLDRMLGVNYGYGYGCGCDSGCGGHHAGGCCDAAPSCGCGHGHGHARRPLFGHRGCGCEKQACGCEAPAPSCGCAAPAPSCGCEASHGRGCESRCCGLGLLDRIFSCHRRSCCNTGCDAGCGAVDSGCGCGGGHVTAPGAQMQQDGDMAPMPPAPVVDPSAFLPSQRRVVHASTNVLR